MAAPIRIECRFCNHPFHVEAKYAGTRIKCPKCKNAIAVPVESAAPPGLELIESRPGPAEGTPMERRPIAGRHSPQAVGRFVKLLLLAGIAVAAWLGWRYFKGLESKSTDFLFKEYADPDTDAATREMIRKIVLDRVETDNLKSGFVKLGKQYATHEEARARALAAEVLGLTKAKSAYDPLSKLVTDKTVEVQKAAVIALGDIRLKESIDTLVEIVSDEATDKDVRGDAKTSLEKLTGEKQPQFDWWKKWWDKERRRDYEIANPAR